MNFMVIKNYIYNIIYQLITVILPIITIPYVSRILGADGLGEYALTSTYAQYFLLIGMLGLTIYSSREIAYVREDEEKLEQTFWELNFLRFLTVGISLLVYIILFFFILNINNKKIYLIQTLIILNGFIDISWLFIGLEDFKKVAIRNTAVKLIGVVLIFLLIKNENQVCLYSLILGGTQFLGQLIMWFEIPSKIKFSYPNKSNIKKHLRFSIKLFIPQIAITVYTMLDKVMLGVMTNDIQVAFYDNSQRIIRIVVVFVTTLAFVTIPKMSNLYSQKKYNEFEKNIYKSFSFVSFLAFPMSFGLIAITNKFVPWFFGKAFTEMIPVFYAGSLLIITLGWSSILGNQVLISIKREKQFTICVTCGAALNIVLNLLLINIYKSLGTMIASILAEYVGMFLMVYFLKDIIKFNLLFKDTLKYIILSIIMSIIVYFIGEMLNASIITTFIQIILGLIIYIISLFFIKDKNLYIGMNFIKDKIKNK